MTISFNLKTFTTGLGLALAVMSGPALAATLTTATTLNSSCGVLDLWNGTSSLNHSQDDGGYAGSAMSQASASSGSVGASSMTSMMLRPEIPEGRPRDSLSAWGCASSVGTEFSVAGPDRIASVGMTLQLDGSISATDINGNTRMSVIAVAALRGTDEFGRMIRRQELFQSSDLGAFPSELVLAPLLFDISQPLFLDLELRVFTISQAFLNIPVNGSVPGPSSASASADFAHTFGINMDGGAVFDLDTGFTAFSAEANVVDNIYVDPTVVVPTVPLPAAGFGLVAAIGLLSAVGRRRRLV